ncbi:hypothetical protein VTJ04DRAFT_734 [Mycothermus thermophilus]|uniref:uncharacterized protein n=1 Tax=Humicola insolens TaxID=85995 RepID=UPI003743E337
MGLRGKQLYDCTHWFCFLGVDILDMTILVSPLLREAGLQWLGWILDHIGLAGVSGFIWICVDCCVPHGRGF